MKACGRLAVAAIIQAIHAYRLLLASWMPPACRFEPSCSRYAEQALRRHGLWGGVWRALSRLSRCHPFHPGGLDPLS